MNARTLKIILFQLAVICVAMPAVAEDAPQDTLQTTVADEIVVTASRYASDVHLSQTNLTRAELERKIGTVDIPLLLEDTPGLFATSESGNGIGYTTLKIRGFDQKRVGVMVNGIPFNDPEDHQVYWVDLPDFAGSLEDIQVQRGITNSMGATTAVGGTVNMITAAHRREAGGRASVMMGSYGTRKFSASYQTGLLSRGFSSILRYSNLETDGYRDWSGSEQWSVFWSGRYVTENTSTQANVYTGHEVTDLAYYGVDEATMAVNREFNPLAAEQGLDDFRQPHYELHHTWYLSDDLQLSNALYHVHGYGFYENLKSGRDIVDFGLDLSLGLDPANFADGEVDLMRRKIVTKNQFGWVPNLTLDHERGRAVFGGDVYTFSSDHRGEVRDVVGVDMDGAERYYAYDGDKTAWSIFFNERFELTSDLTLLADLQYQHKTWKFKQDELLHFTGADRHAYEVDYDFFNPKGGLHWRLPAYPLGGEASVYAHVGVTHREPTDSELFDTWSGPDDLGVAPLFRDSTPVDEDGDGQTDYLQWSNPYIVEEKAVNYELGTSWRGQRVSWTLNGYWMDFDNEILDYGMLNKDGVAIRGNAQRTLHRGIELGLSAQLHPRHLLTVAASRSWDEFDDFTYYEIVDWDTYASEARDYGGNPIALFPESLMSLGLRSDFGALGTAVRLRGVGKQHLDNSGMGDRVIDAYTTTDISFQLIPAELGLGGLGNTRIDLRIRNLFDKEYATSGYWDWSNYYFPAAGRNILAGVHYSF
jgi:iron complex outermembrane recepter protein